MRLDTRAVANHLGSTADEIRKALPKAQTALFSVAYGTFEGLKLITPELKEFLGRHGRLRAMLDIDRHFTDPVLIDDLYTMPGDVECKLFGPRIKNPSVLESVAFHSKIYYFDDTRNATAIVGSSNLSTGGLVRNYETSVVLRGEINHPVFVSLRKIFDDFWGNPYAIDTSLYPKFREAYATAYAKAKVLNPRPGIPIEIPLEVEPEVLAELQQEFGNSKERIIRNTSAYIAGLIAGGFHKIDYTSRTIDIKFQRGVVNPQNDLRGRIQFPGISERNLDQVECVLRDAERIEERLQTSFLDATTGDTISRLSKPGKLVHNLTIQFSDNSAIWKSLRELYGSSFRRLSQYMFPGKLDDKDLETLASFVKGYMHVRTRISVSDRYPNGDLRIAISASGSAPKFSRQLRAALLELFETEERSMTMLDGADRNRETLIRFDPALIPQDYLLSPWQQLVVKDFINYNEESHASKKHNANQLAFIE